MTIRVLATDKGEGASNEGDEDAGEEEADNDDGTALGTGVVQAAAAKTAMATSKGK